MPASHTRRGMLGRVAGLASAFAGITTTTAATDSTTATDSSAPTQRDWLQYSSAREPRPPATDLVHHLESGIRYTTNESGTHMLALAGEFAVTTPDDLPPSEGAANTESQSIRVVNKTPMRISVDFPETPVALYPGPVGGDGILSRVGVVGGISAVTFALLRKVGLALLKRSIWGVVIAAGTTAVAKHLLKGDRDQSNIHQWHGFTPQWNDLQGAHHARIPVTETATGSDSPGRLLVASQTRHAANAWQLTFHDGLADVTPLETPASVLDTRPLPRSLSDKQPAHRGGRPRTTEGWR